MNGTFCSRVKEEPDARKHSMARSQGEYGIETIYKRRRLSSDSAEDPAQAPLRSPSSISRVTRRSPMTKISSLVNSPDHPPPPKPHVSPPFTEPPTPNGHPSQPALGHIVSPEIATVSDPAPHFAQRPSSQDNHPSRWVSSGTSSSANGAGSPIHTTWNTMLSVKPSMDRSSTVYRFPPVDAAPRRTRTRTPEPSHKTSPVDTSSDPPRRRLQSDALPEPPLYYAEQERVHMSPEHPKRPATDYLPPIRRRSLAPPAKAWFAIGRTNVVNMRQWDQAGRRAYERGYEDALAALQRGVVGIDGKEYSCPVLVNREEPIRYKYVNGRRLSVETSSFQQLYSGLTNGDLRRPSIDGAYLQYDQPLSSAGSEDLSPDHTVPPPMRRNSKFEPGYMSSDYQPYTFLSTAYPAHTTTSSPNGTTRNLGQRQLISCYPCRSRKMKCDGQKPCSQCVKRGGESDCEYAAEVRRRGKGKKLRGGEVGRSGTEDSSQESLIMG